MDDEDLGDVIIYTGEGGRDPTTGRQVADQQLTLGNRALAEKTLNGIPIRVHRSKAHVPNMPDGSLYRYDGLYRVASYWQEVGKDGFKIYRFRIEKLIPDFTLDPILIEPPSGVTPAGNEIPNRRQSTVTRIVRSTPVAESVKQLHDFTCQICGTRLVTPVGAYAEACHIRPLGRPHDGPDVKENVLCLCPNCHVLLDELAVWINDDHSIGGRGGVLVVHPRHAVSSEYFQYHRRMCGRSGPSF